MPAHLVYKSGLVAELTLQEALELAIRHHQSGRLSEAESLYRSILKTQPNHPDALHLLGLIAQHAKQHAAAIDLIRRAIAVNPNWPDACYHLAVALKDAGQLDEAIAAYRRAIELDPGHALAFNGLGNVLREHGEMDQAIAALQSAVRLKPDYAEAHCNLGVMLQSNGQLNPAIDSYRRAIALRPNYPEAHSNLSIALREIRQTSQAIDAAKQAIALRPDYAEAHHHLGLALHDAGMFAEAIAAHHRAIELNPDFPQADGSLGNALLSSGQLDAAIAAYRRAITLRPAYAVARNNLGNALMDSGDATGAIAEYRQAVALEPANALMHSALVFAMHYHPDYDPAGIAGEHARWNTRHADPLRGLIQPHRNDRDPDRRLRIGYVSPDFRNHPVGRFLLPLLENHDHERFEIFGYGDVATPDEITARIQSSADNWREIRGKSHDRIAEMIREDRIDILVDLSGHTSSNRLLVFARKPAPVQVSYLGYPGDLGMKTIGYRMTDLRCDPASLGEHCRTRMLCPAKTNWCFAAPENSPPMAAPPSAQRGYVTFGSFNNLAKLTDVMLGVWAGILQEVPNSRLLLKAAAFAAASACDRINRTLAGQGIDLSRVTLLGPRPDLASHLAAYAEIDIALDTFPYNGTTTICEALWMGVPVITLAGKTHVSRVGLSLLTSLDLPDLLVSTSDDYVQAAVALCKNRERRNDLRMNLRDRMTQSPLMDAIGFARDVERAYRQIWCDNLRNLTG